MNQLNKKEIIPALLIIIAATLWGTDGAVLRPYLYSLQAKVVVFSEHAIAFALMLAAVVLFILINKAKLPLWLKKDIESIKNLPTKGWYAVAWIAFFGGMVGTIAITKALFYVNFIPLSIPILVQKLQPIFGILLAVILLKEKPRKNFYFWAVLALIGSYFITFGFDKPVISLDNKALVAALLGLLAAFSWGTSTAFGKAALKDLTYRAATFLRFCVTSVFVFILLIATNSLTGINDISLKQILVLLLIAFTTGGTAIFIYYKGLKKVKASASTIYELAFPLTVIILDFVLRGKIMSVPQFIGAAILLFAIIKVTKEPIPEQIQIKKEKYIN